MSEVQFQKSSKGTDGIVRRIVSTPVRSSSDTWTAITALLAPDPGSDARRELSMIRGLVCAAISSEAMRHDPLVIRSQGITVRIYCLHGEDAIMSPGYDLQEFAWCPTDAEWQLSIPCEPDDVRWLNRELATISKNVIFRATGENPHFGAHVEESNTARPRRGLSSVLKLGAFFRS